VSLLCGDKTTLRKWSSVMADPVITYVVRNFSPSIEGDSMIYDLTRVGGQIEKITKLPGQSFQSLQFASLIRIGQLYDVGMSKGAKKLGLRSQFRFEDPLERDIYLNSCNMFPMVIPNMPQRWVPRNKVFEYVDRNVADSVLKWDKHYFSRYIGDLSREVLCPINHLSTGIKLVDRVVPSLKILCCRVLSAYNLAYGGTEKYPYVTNVIYYVERMLHVRLQKFPRKFPSFRPGFDFEPVNRALNFWYSYCVRSKKKVRFTFEPHHFSLIPLGNKKNGFERFPTLGEIETKYCTYRFVDNPSKNQALVSILRDFSAFMISAAIHIKDGMVPIEKHFKQPITSLSFKDENRSSLDEGTLNPDKVREYNHKGRIFALYKDSFLGRFLQFRKIERTYYPYFHLLYPGARNLSAHIEIGTSWLKGGAKLKYDALFGELGDKYELILDNNDITYRSYRFVSAGTQKFFDGDISSLDTSIGAMHLVFYQMFSLVWLERDDKDPMYLLIQCIIEALAEMLAGKTVRWIEDFMLIIGFMPSGSLETSHGNSWIMIMFYWLAYIFTVMAESEVSVRKRIWMYLLARRIINLFFGDDFLGGSPRDLDEISVEGFAEFIFVKYGVVMKNKNTYNSLITYHTVVGGTVLRTVYTGPVYLKRQFVMSENFGLTVHHPNICPIVPWRPLMQYKWRMAVPKDRGAPVFRNLSRLIGLAYDTIGVEPLAFYMIKFVFDIEYEMSCHAYGKQNVDRMIPELLADDRKYLLKIGMQGIPERFPDYDELLHLNYMDREYHLPKYSETRTWQESVLEVENW